MSTSGAAAAGTGTGPLAGIRVLEVAMYGFVPSAGAVLADWGADVVKVEHAVNGDPQRGLRQTGAFKVEGDPNPNVEHANRGKRSLGLDMARPEGKEVLHGLIRRSDVFLTSFLPAARRKLGIDVDDVRAVNPRIVYARGSALGPRGRESDKGGYDMTAFWARAGTAASLTPAGTEGMIPPPGPAYGDTISGTNLAGGIAAALLKRERTGEASVVDVSLLGSGVWALGHGIALSVHLDKPMIAPPVGAHGSPTNPLSGLYRTADDRYLAFVMMQPGKFWADVCRHVDRPELADDPRFAAPQDLVANTEEAVKILREVLATRTLAEWTERFATLAGPWAPVQDSLQVGSDPQVRANEYLVRAGELELAASPVQFDVGAPRLGPAPEFAAQTEEVLLELGLDWERIAELKAAGAVT
ncbi:carnitine dehydratase [Streptomyces sp. MMG1533]|uniref:CaiB/BaiF CoA transferase family protein n=1 Tax=Streptomyces sp. MMG1533 TaxID=1415546 RepID=UPI0006ADE5B3|nr:CoA transferase [Streptomyces sp. MMG1533]KOU56994.1 carnitine dehydratase [Streptomyces sp. MMG1533]